MTEANVCPVFAFMLAQIEGQGVDVVQPRILPSVIHVLHDTND